MKRTTIAEREKEELTTSILEYFASVPDPWGERTRHHSLTDILTVSLCAVICGVDAFCAIETYGWAREAWLRTFVGFRGGSLGRVFAALNPDALAEGFRQWILAVARLTKGEVVAIDGKTLRRSFHEAGGHVFVHMVRSRA